MSAAPVAAASAGSRAVVPPKGRCINPRHSQPCWVCKLPPSKDKEGRYALTGMLDVTGVDRLRKHVEQSPEWASQSARMQLAANHADKPELARLCESLISGNASALTKEDLLQVCRDWKFRSDIWQQIPREQIAQAGGAAGASGSASASAADKGKGVLAALGAMASHPEHEHGGGGDVGGVGPSTSASAWEKIQQDHQCIDPGHSQPCRVCLPAPSEEEEFKYQLVGDPGRKNGEKKLRKFIQMTREWNDKEVRAQVADAFAGRADLTVFSRVVRNKEAANLRKPHLLRLCREWRFRSNIWQRKKMKHPKDPKKRYHQLPAGTPRQTPRKREREATAAEAHVIADVEGRAFRSESVAEIFERVTQFLARGCKDMKAHSPPLQRGPHIPGAAPGGALAPTAVTLTTADLARIFQPMRQMLESTAEMFDHFSTSNEAHMRNFGVDDMNVISLIASAQTVGLHKMKMDAAKVELMRMHAQLPAFRAGSLALFELSTFGPSTQILAEVEAKLLEILNTVPPVFPQHLRHLLSSILVSGLQLFSIGQAVARLMSFYELGVYIQGLIHVTGLCIEFEDQVLNAFHGAVRLVLSIMTSSSRVSPLIQNTIQSLLATEQYGPTSPRPPLQPHAFAPTQSALGVGANPHAQTQTMASQAMASTIRGARPPPPPQTQEQQQQQQHAISRGVQRRVVPARGEGGPQTSAVEGGPSDAPTGQGRDPSGAAPY